MRRSKYNAQKTVVDQIRFDSKKEADRYKQLKLLLKAQVIENLKLQVTFELYAGIKYKADFTYIENGKPVVEDVKGYRTDVYRMKAKMFKHKYPELELREV